MSMESSRIKGSIVALVTPMDEEGGVNHETLKQLVEWHIEQGTDCIVAVGTTGESPTVTVDEQCAIIKTCVEQAKGRIPIMAGCGANSTQEAITLAKHAKELGADCQLQVVPYYNKPTQEGLYSHFVAIADAIDLPVMLYNVPGRTVADLQHDTVLRLAQHPNILGIKEATGNLERAQWLIREAPKDFSVYSGDDATAVMLMLAGGSGNVSVTANVAPRLMSELCMAAMGKNVERAMSLQYQLLPLHKSLFCEANPIPVKWAVSRIGKCKNTLRLPMTPLSAANCKVVEESLVKVGLID